MLKVTTESGAVYLIDLAEGRAKRVGPYSDGIDYANVPDLQWVTWSSISEVEEGKGIIMLNATRYRVTTNVVKIEDVTDIEEAE